MYVEAYGEQGTRKTMEDEHTIMRYGNEIMGDKV